MNKFITTLLCLAGSAILFNANAVEREYTQFTAFQTSGSETIIPDGKYIFVAPNSSSNYYYMNPLDSYNGVSVSTASNGNITANSDCEVYIHRSDANKYILQASNGKYINPGSVEFSISTGNSSSTWNFAFNPSGSDAQISNPLNFSCKPLVTTFRLKFRKISKDFTQTRWTTSDYPYPTLYTVVPSFSATANIGGTQTEIANDGVLNALVTNVTSGSKVTFNTDGASTLKYSVNGGAEIIPSSASFDVNIDSAIGSTTVTVTATDANGTAYTNTVTINVGEAPVIPQNDEAVSQGSEENTWSADVTESDATGVSLTSYAIDGSSTVASKPNGVLTISDFSLKNARYIVQASNNFLTNQSLEFNFISTINNKLSALFGDDAAPYQAYIVFTNNSDRVTEGYPQSIDIPMTPNSDYTEWTCDFDNILGYSAQELFSYIPWIATEFKIELKIVPRDSNTPMILSGKGMTVAEMPGRNREAAARITAQDSTPYSFVVDGGEPLIYNAGLSADESTYNMIAGSAKFEPFIANSINLSASSNIETGITDINPDANEAEYYNLQGIRVDNPENGIYIRRQGNKTTKVIL
ncbi:MAG: hypothetical protein ACI304_01235 [Lepagella sp.]